VAGKCLAQLKYAQHQYDTDNLSGCEKSSFEERVKAPLSKKDKSSTETILEKGWETSAWDSQSLKHWVELCVLIASWWEYPVQVTDGHHTIVHNMVPCPKCQVILTASSSYFNCLQTVLQQAGSPSWFHAFARFRVHVLSPCRALEALER